MNEPKKQRSIHPIFCLAPESNATGIKASVGSGQCSGQRFCSQTTGSGQVDFHSFRLDGLDKQLLSLSSDWSLPGAPIEKQRRRIPRSEERRDNYSIEKTKEAVSEQSSRWLQTWPRRPRPPPSSSCLHSSPLLGIAEDRKVRPRIPSLIRGKSKFLKVSLHSYPRYVHSA